MINTNIILIGMKACGKSTVGKLVAEKLGMDFTELDQEIEKAYFKDKKVRLTFREIFKKYGQKYFRSLESAALRNVSQEMRNKKFVLACGGGTPLNIDNQKLLSLLGTIIYLDTDEKVLLPRITKHGIPAFFTYQNNPTKSLNELLEKRRPIYQKIAMITIAATCETPQELMSKVISALNSYEN